MDNFRGGCEDSNVGNFEGGCEDNNVGNLGVVVRIVMWVIWGWL